MSCAKRFFSVAGTERIAEFKRLFGGKKIKICDTLRAVTPFGALSVFGEFLGRIGLAEQLASGAPTSPKAAITTIPDKYWSDSS